MKREVTVHAGTETATFNTAAKAATADVMVIGVAVSAASGTTPTLDCEVEWSADGTNFASAPVAQTLGQLTAAGAEFLRVEAQAKYYRIAATIAGTSPSFTVAIDAVHFE